MGNRVFSGIGLTKILGLIVLAFAPALYIILFIIRIFRIYFFRVYFAVVIFGLFNGLFVIPPFLSRFGPNKIEVKEIKEVKQENKEVVPTYHTLDEPTTK